MKRVNVQLTEELHTKAKIIAVLRNETLNDYFARVVAEAIKKDQKVLEKIPR